jgi:GH24 family phage-related lysozyme (muramidase)
MAKVYYGKDAIREVEKKEGRKLSYAERRVVEEEGYVPNKYKDTKGIVTYGVGQTGKYMDMSFDDTYKAHVDEARRLIPNLDTLPEKVQAEIIQATYRGDVGGSPTFRKLLNEGEYDKAAQEFLNNDEYRNTENTGIRQRMEKVASALTELSKKPSSEAPYPESTDRYKMEVLSKPNVNSPAGVKRVQKIIGVDVDGVWGPQSQKMFDIYNRQTYDNTVNPVSATYREEQPVNITEQPTGFENPFLAAKNWWNSL